MDSENGEKARAVDVRHSASLIPLHACSENLLLPPAREANVKNLQSVLFPISPRKSYSAESYLSNSFLKFNNHQPKQDDTLVDPKASFLKSRDSKELFIKDLQQIDHVGQPSRWPTECQVLDKRIKHITYRPCPPEPYYTTTENEAQPKPVGEESGYIVYQYYPINAVNYFCRSSIGGSQYLLPTCPAPEEDSLQFESRFESGNLAKVIKITANYYELYLRSDLYTNRHMQWFYFRTTNMKKNVLYRFSIVNLSKEDSLYAEGMRPLLYSEKDAQLHSIGWRRCGDNITYFCNDNGTPEDPDQQSTYTLTFTLEFPHEGDTVYFAHSYPYTYSDLQDYLLSIAAHPVKSTFTTLRLLCKTLAGNNVYYVTITTPPGNENPKNKKKKAIVITARVHPGETPSSWMMHGFLDFLTSDSGPAKELRDNFIFKLVPMLNPDGVIVGNNRCSLTGKDLNRQYRTVIRETYPSIWYTKLMIRRLIEECGVAMYCDLHAHSRKHNIFMFGCECRKGVDRKLHEQVFPLMLHKNAADKFCFENCKFKIQKCKEGTGRVVMWMMGISNSFTMEASFGGTTIGGRAETHFNTLDYEQMGRSFCQTLLDFYDSDPRKEKLRIKIINRLVKGGSNADEPANIQLSDYSSDGGDTSASDSEFEFPAIKVPKNNLIAPPPSPIKLKKLSPLKVKSVKVKSPRKTMQVVKANLNFPKKLISSDTSSASETEPEITKETIKPLKKKKKKKKKKCTKKCLNMEYSDVEIGKDYSMIDMTHHGQLLQTVFQCRRNFQLRYENKRLSSQQRLSEVQSKLFALKNKLWLGLGDVNTHKPISWVLPNSKINVESKANRKKSAEKRKPLKKSKTKEESKEKNKKQKEGLKRQPAIDFTPLLKTTKVRRSKSLSESCKDVNILSTNFVERREEVDGNKKKNKKNKCKTAN
ncbi:PREDICTED: cytosolic carboxypeptidase 2-like [Nicrophorus vespilloides]|uniref:Cytosolic carboxypeptidase 2-like n=1 Tax=Nicrophorus vespilloides TaxID=110193 RepID=A0ABM1NAT4_NICVS|nr:PREDICTED: cytosolic carboxypeptidase 2-like [Nicrophorus vespilloides]